MKYAVPLDTKDDINSIVGMHFGHVPFYAIWNDENDEIDIIDNKSDHKGGSGLPMEFLANHCNGVLLKGAGARAVMIGQELGLAIYMGADGTLKDTIQRFKDGTLHLATKDDGCSH
ncbi:MAG: dinitrogenase iron-molybdenum cofactor biosynthesis protein [Candidatus Heimdallarchaeota archaeon]|nr:dinitrogenase iron-molybdenum cofactor biosynthesis protein [Candidatus Heimdallarchaeota archaeon]